MTVISVIKVYIWLLFHIYIWNNCHTFLGFSYPKFQLSLQHTSNILGAGLHSETSHSHYVLLFKDGQLLRFKEGLRHPHAENVHFGIHQDFFFLQ